MSNKSSKRAAKRAKRKQAKLEKVVKRYEKEIGGSRQRKPIVPAEIDEHYDRVVWSFAFYDNCSEWQCDEPDVQRFRDVAERLKQFEEQTWQQIEAAKKQNHPIESNRLGESAQRRLEELLLDDCEEVWTFHFSGKERLWGIRDRQFFQVLWWDPDHRVYPIDLQDREKSSAG